MQQDTLVVNSLLAIQTEETGRYALGALSKHTSG
jgi:hypothetical protein